MEIVVTGIGYVGLVTAVCLSEIGHKVTCVDIDKEKIENLNNGISTIYEPGLEEMLNKNRNLLKFSSDINKAYRKADIIYITVGTPENKDGSANLKYVYDVAKNVAENIENDCIVVIKSTVPIGTNSKIENFIKSNIKNKVNVEVVSNPEFLSQGTAIRDTLYAKRIVLGVSSKKAEKIMRKIYDGFKQPYIITGKVLK